MPARPSLAEHYRHHRQAFLLALELGCTPKEAEAEMKRREARERARAAEARLEDKMQGQFRSNSAPADRSGDESWMLRD